MNTMSISMQPGFGSNAFNLMGSTQPSAIPPTSLYGVAAGPNLNNIGMYPSVQPQPNGTANTGLNLLGSLNMPSNPTGITMGAGLNTVNLPNEANFAT